MRLWRLTRPAHAPGLDGEGARIYGGRWNGPGRPMVYAAASPSLAALEVFVHLEADQRSPSGLPPMVLVGLDLDDALIERPGAVPDDPRAQRVWGDEWLQAGRSLAVAVPSAVMRWEDIVLINPRHASLAAVRVALVEPFNFDPRLATPA